MSRYEGRVAVVTGSARGIGAATAQRFAERGCGGRRPRPRPGLRPPRPPPASGAARAIGVACDVSDAASVEAAVARVVEQLGQVDVLVNNAGVTRDNLLFKMTEDDWDAVMGVHLQGRVPDEPRGAEAHGRREVRQDPEPLQRLRPRQPRPGELLGRQDGPAGLHPHAGPRARAVRHQRQRDRPRLHRHRHDRRHRAPGRAWSRRTYREARRGGNPVRRVGHPEDIAATAAFLCSDEASFITGQTLYVDGGAKV